MSHVSKPIGLTRHTHELILLYLATIGGPARTSEVRQAVTAICPEAASPIYGCLGDLLTAGRVKRLTTVEIDLDGVAEWLGKRAFRNKSKQSRAMDGLLKATARETTKSREARGS
jgi:hypothetical protein